MRLWVRLPPVAAVYQRQLSVPSLRGQLMSSSLRAMGRRPSAADWGGGMSVVLHCGSTCLPSQVVDGCISCRGTISSCQSAATSKIVKRCCSRMFSCKQCYIKYPDLYFYLLKRVKRTFAKVDDATLLSSCPMNDDVRCYNYC